MFYRPIRGGQVTHLCSNATSKKSPLSQSWIPAMPTSPEMRIPTFGQGLHISITPVLLRWATRYLPSWRRDGERKMRTLLEQLSSTSIPRRRGSTGVYVAGTTYSFLARNSTRRPGWPPRTLQGFCSWGESRATGLRSAIRTMTPIQLLTVK